MAYYHLPGLFEFYGLYRMFLPLFYHHREYFYNWCAIGSIYGALGDCIWGGGRTSFGVQDPEDVMDLMREYGISARLTFSNSLLREEHLADISATPCVSCYFVLWELCQSSSLIFSFSTTQPAISPITFTQVAPISHRVLMLI